MKTSFIIPNKWFNKFSNYLSSLKCVSVTGQRTNVILCAMHLKSLTLTDNSAPSPPVYFLFFNKYEEINCIISSDLAHWRGIPTRRLVIVAGSCYLLRPIRTIWKKIMHLYKCAFETTPGSV